MNLHNNARLGQTLNHGLLQRGSCESLKHSMHPLQRGLYTSESALPDSVPWAELTCSEGSQRQTEANCYAEQPQPKKSKK